MKNYDGEQITALSFVVDTGCNQIPIKLPAKVDECLKVLELEKKRETKNVKATKEQAERVAWRILKDWVESQMALLDIQMVKFEEVFMPYIVDKHGRTLFEKLEEQQFLIGQNNDLVEVKSISRYHGNNGDCSRLLWRGF